MIPRVLRFCCTAALMLVLLAPPAVVRAFELKIDGDRITVQASKVPLQRLLKAISRNGIVVRADPEINPPVTLSFRDRDLEQGLKAVLRPNNHVLIWRTRAAYASSTAPGVQLSEIHVFKPGQKERMVALATPEPAVAEQAPNPDEGQDDDPPPAEETRVVIVGNKVFVPVILGYQDRQVETTLIFDTGAGSIVLHQNVAEELGIDATQPSNGQGVGGIPIQTRRSRLDYVQVGPHKKENLRTDIVEFQGTPNENYNGLLGMNFIRGLKYTIDFDQQVIRWQP